MFKSKDKLLTLPSRNLKLQTKVEILIHKWVDNSTEHSNKQPRLLMESKTTPVLNNSKC